MRAYEVTSSAVLRDARSRADLTQRLLATPGGVSRSVVAAHEIGAREPSLSTLAALVEATDVSLGTTSGDDLGPRRERTGPIGHRPARAAPPVSPSRHGTG